MDFSLFKDRLVAEGYSEDTAFACAICQSLQMRGWKNRQSTLLVN